MVKEVPKILMITRSVLVEKFKINGAIARALINDMVGRGEISAVGDQHHSFGLFKGSQAKTAKEKAEIEAAELAAKEAKKNKGK